MRSVSWDNLVVLCAANNWDDVKLADQHMAECLTRHAPVLYVDPPMSVLTPRNRPDLAGALEKPHLRLVGPRLARLTPVMPPRGLRPGLMPFTEVWLRYLVGRAIRQLTSSVRAVIMGVPGWTAFGVAHEGLRVFWAQDDFAGGAALMGLDRQRVLKAELATANGAQVLVTSSPSVQQAWRERGRESTLIPFGCDAARFANQQTATPGDVSLVPPIAGFVGHLNQRTDLALLEAVAASGLSLLLVGPVGRDLPEPRLSRLLDRANVQSVGPKLFDDLPSYLGMIDVGLVPYGPGEFNIGSFPLKTLEYLAAGVPVVSTGLPATRWLDTNLISIADSPTDFAAAAWAAARGRRDQSEIRRRQRFASGHDWDSRAAAFAAVLGIVGAAPLGG